MPEASDYIASNREEANKLAEPLNGNVMSEYKKLAKSLNIWLSVGGFHERLEGVSYFIFQNEN